MRVVQSTYLQAQPTTIPSDAGRGVVAARQFREGDAIMIYKGIKLGKNNERACKKATRRLRVGQHDRHLMIIGGDVTGEVVNGDGWLGG